MNDLILRLSELAADPAAAAAWQITALAAVGIALTFIPSRWLTLGRGK